MTKRPIFVTAAAALLLSLSLAGGWLLLPWVLTRKANAVLGDIEGYRGSVERVWVGVFPPSVMVRNLALEKREEAAPGFFFSLSSGTVAVSSWGSIYGRLRLKLDLVQPRARFLMRQRRPDQKRKFALWQSFFARWPAFRISSLSIVDGSLRLQNLEDIPPLDLSFDQINGEAFNLANRPGLLRDKPRLEGTARMMGHAPLTLVVETRPFQERVNFQLQGSLKGFRLSTLNPVLRHYTGVDMEGGTMDVEGTLAASDGRFEGRVHRVLNGLQVITAHERHPSFVPLLKEVVLQTWLNGRKNAGGDIQGDYVLSGPLGYMNADVFLAGVWTAKSAFLQSLRPTLPKEVRMGSPQQAEEEWMALQAKERKKQKPAGSASNP